MNMQSIMLSSQSNEWYTPARYVEAAREVMGSIDLDPASCEMANKAVQATRYFSEENNALMLPWIGRIWLNPPYGKLMGYKSNTEVWIARLFDQLERGNITEAIVMVNHMTCAQWFQPLLDYPICLTDHRVNFHSEKVGGGPTQGAAFVYIGTQEQKFIKVFRQFGRIIRAIDETPETHPIAFELWQ